MSLVLAFSATGMESIVNQRWLQTNTRFVKPILPSFVLELTFHSKHSNIHPKFRSDGRDFSITLGENPNRLGRIALDRDDRWPSFGILS